MTTLQRNLPEPRRWHGRLLGAAVALFLIVGLSRPALPNVPQPAPPVPDVLDGAPALDAAGTLGLLPPDQRVAFWEARVAAGGSFLDLIHLADAYLDRSRASGALDDLQRAATALDRAAKTAPYPEQVTVRRALVAFALHDFAGAIRRADAVLAETPTDLAALGVAGDARLETGDVDGARHRYEKLARFAPSPAAWSRLGRLAYLTGDADGAIRLVSRAVAAARDEGAPDAVAFYQFQIGELRRAGGDVAEAAVAYEAALAALPDYVPAMAGLAATREATGDRAAAIRLLERATARLPQPELVAALGDIYALDGRTADAERQYRLVESIAKLASAGGSVYDRQLIVFAADHQRNVQEAVARARADLAVRGDIYGHDALAWALFRAGELAEAAMEAEAALALGTPDPRLAYHAGMIAAASGDAQGATALLRRAVAGAAFLPPLQAQAAREALSGLEAGQTP
jgi:tetratricopeptide (TPR) repeat protein